MKSMVPVASWPWHPLLRLLELTGFEFPVLCSAVSEMDGWKLRFWLHTVWDIFNCLWCCFSPSFCTVGWALDLYANCGKCTSLNQKGDIRNFYYSQLSVDFHFTSQYSRLKHMIISSIVASMADDCMQLTCRNCIGLNITIVFSFSHWLSWIFLPCCCDNCHHLQCGTLYTSWSLNSTSLHSGGSIERRNDTYTCMQH